MAQLQQVTDPSGLSINIPEGFCPPPGENPEDFYADAFSAIRKPAFFIKLDNDKVRYYYRSLGWGITVLIKAVQDATGWSADSCRYNPSITEVRSLAQQGELVGGK
jgi:hypothetical protein